MLVILLRAGAAGLLLMTVLAACTGAAAPSGVATLQSPGAGETRPRRRRPRSTPRRPAWSSRAACATTAWTCPTRGAAEGGPVAIGGATASTSRRCRRRWRRAGRSRRRLRRAGGDRSGDAGQDARIRRVHARQRRGLPGPGRDRRRRPIDRRPGRQGVDPSSDEFQAAQEACQDMLGEFASRRATDGARAAARPAEPEVAP